MTTTTEYKPKSRRPIADIFRLTARGAVDACVRLNIHPDAVSYASIAASACAVSFSAASAANCETDAAFEVVCDWNAVIAFAIIYLSWLMSAFRGLPNVLIVMALLISIYTFLTTRTTLGRRIYALGGNENAAKLSGINTQRLTFLTFINMGLLSALAGYTRDLSGSPAAPLLFAGAMLIFATLMLVQYRVVYARSPHVAGA